MYDCKKGCNKTYETEKEAEECCKDKGQEIVANNEPLKDTNYHKDYIAFVIKPLHIDQAHRWAKWCSDRGLDKKHHKAFALAMDILEGKTQDIINSSKHLEDIELLLRKHDELLTSLVQSMSEMSDRLNEPQEEEPDANQKAREDAKKRKEKREAREKAKELANSEKKEVKKNG